MNPTPLSAAPTPVPPGAHPWIRRGTVVNLGLILPLILALALGATAWAARSAGAAAYPVNTTADGADAIPGDGTCETSTPGECTLRAAVQEANALPGPDSIALPAGTYSLSLVGLDDTAAAGDLDIVDDLTITGAGLATTTIDASAISERAFDAFSVTFSLSALTVTGGGSTADWGGALYARGATAVTVITDVALDGNVARGGAGLTAFGTTTLTNVQITNNGGVAAPVYVLGPLSATQLTVTGNAVTNAFAGLFIAGSGSSTITDSTISANTAGGPWGGLFVGSGTTTIERTTVSNNEAQQGAGIGSGPAATLTITDSAVTGNRAAGGGLGGGFYAIGSASLERTIVSGNSAGDAAGGIFAGGSTITDSTISENSAIGGTGSLGGQLGGVALIGDSTLQNSTISGNTAAGNGGGVFHSEGTLTIDSATITDNSAVGGNGGLYAAAPNEIGAGSAGSTTEITNTIIGDQQSGADCGGLGAVTSNGFNIDSDGSCSLVEPSDQPSVSPLLGPLVTNPVGTKTHLPQPGSPALDAGSTGLGADQRAIPRPQGGTADIGAVELRAALVLQVNNPADIADDQPGDGTCQAAGQPAGTCTLRAAVDETNSWVVEAGGPSQIEIQPALPPIVLTIDGAGEDANASGDIDVTSDLSILGNGATIDAASLPSGDRVLEFHGAGAVSGSLDDLTLTLDDLTVTGGNLGASWGGGLRLNGLTVATGLTVTGNQSSQQGGGISVTGQLDLRDSVVDSNSTLSSSGGGGSGPVTLSRVTITGNSAEDFGGGWYRPTEINDTTIAGNSASNGGGIDSSGSVITRSAIFDNSATEKGGGIYAPDGVTLENSTVSGNTVASPLSITRGGGIYGRVNLKSSTVTGNAADVGSGIHTTTGSTSYAANSIIASQATGLDCVGNLTSSGYNLDGGTSCGVEGATDQQNAEVLLLPLADNGGPTLTHLPSGNSPAIDTGAGACPATDQRGTVRPQNGLCDSGAVEGAGPVSLPQTYVVNTSADGPDLSPGDGICLAASGKCTIRAAIDEANAHPGPDTVKISIYFNTKLSLAGRDDDANATGDLDITESLVIDGQNRDIDAATLDRVLDIHYGTVTLVDLLVTRGSVGPSGDGGGIRTAAGTSISLVNTDLTANTAGWNAMGGGISASGSLNIQGGTIVANVAQYGGGVAALANADITGATIASNDGYRYGGGIYSLGQLTVTDTEINNNSWPSTTGGGIYLASGLASSITDSYIQNNYSGTGGGVATINTPLSIKTSRITDNDARRGAGLYVSGAQTDVVLTTLGGNDASEYAGAIDISNANVTLTGVSLGTNTAAWGVDQVRLQGTGSVTATAGIVLNGDCSPGFVSGGYNLDELGQCVTSPVATDLVGVDPEVFNFVTMLLPRAGSPAVDAIPFGAPGLCDSTYPMDQRGKPRPEPAGGNCDIGAVERQPGDL